MVINLILSHCNQHRINLFMSTSSVSYHSISILSCTQKILVPKEISNYTMTE